MFRTTVIILVSLLVLLSTISACTTHSVSDNILSLSLTCFRYVFASGFILYILICNEAGLFVITKKNVGVLIYLAITGSICITSLLLPKLVLHASMSKIYLILSNPVTTIPFLSVILKNPQRYARRTGSALTLLATVIFLLAQDNCKNVLSTKNMISDWLVLGLLSLWSMRTLWGQYQKKTSSRSKTIDASFHKNCFGRDEKKDAYFK